MKMTSMLSAAFVVLVALQLVTPGVARAEQTPSYYTTDNGAIDGYDPVAYFVDHQARRGKPDIRLEWQGATWHFVSELHRNLFKENPENFAPQFGGYCALGMAHGGAVLTDPEAWSIWEGKLYLNMIDEVRTSWRYAPDKFIERASRQWATIDKQ